MGVRKTLSTNWIFKEERKYKGDVKSIENDFPIMLIKENQLPSVVYVNPLEIEERERHYQEKGFKTIRQKKT